MKRIAPISPTTIRAMKLKNSQQFFGEEIVRMAAGGQPLVPAVTIEFCIGAIRHCQEIIEAEEAEARRVLSKS